VRVLYCWTEHKRAQLETSGRSSHVPCADAAGALQVVMQPWIGEQAARLGKAAATASP
jgi:hypothetical protein